MVTIKVLLAASGPKRP